MQPQQALTLSCLLSDKAMAAGLTDKISPSSLNINNIKSGVLEDFFLVVVNDSDALRTALR